MYKELYDIPKYNNWKRIDKINEGWSSESKYYIEDNNNNKLLLRVGDISNYDIKRREFEIIKKINSLDFTMSKAIEFGVCNNGQNVYMLLSWVEGISLNKGLKKLTEDEQYNLGMQAGRILKEIHSLKVEEIDFPVIDKKEKMLLKLNKYENSMVRIENDEAALDFVKNNINKINLSAPAYKHGDFHVGNLILTNEKEIGVIDFNRWECGDRYEEFYKVQSFDVEVSIPFSIGQIDGYFDKEPSDEFWNVLAVYVAFSSLYSIAWAEKFGEEDVKGMKMRCTQAFEDYNNFESVIPNWYINEYFKYRK